jgi:hypothetical protein
MTTKGSHRWKPIGYWEIVSHILDQDETEWEDNETISNYVYESVDSFMEEWQLDDNATEIGMSAVENAVRQAIEDNVNKSLARHRMNAVANAIESVLHEAGVPSNIEQNDKRFTLIVEVSSPAMMKVWELTTEGVGIVAWDPSLHITDIKNVKQLVDILNARAKVYGGPSIGKRYRKAVEDVTPNTGNMSTIYNIAVKANKKARQGH